MSVFFGRNLERWQSSISEEVVEPELEIFDPHFHLWNPLKEKRGIATTAAKVVSKLSPKLKEVAYATVFPKKITNSFSKYLYFTRRYEHEHLFKDFGGHNVTKGVVIESGWRVAKDGMKQFENLPASEHYNKVSATLKEEGVNFSLAVAAFIDLNLPEDKVREAIEKHIEVNPHVRSVRHGLAWDKSKKIMSASDATKNMSSTESFRKGLAVLEEKNIVFEVWCFHTQLGEVKTILQDFPELTVVLNHIGIPLKIGPYSKEKEKVEEDWYNGLKALEDFKNIRVKVSGMLMPYTAIGDFFVNKTAPSSDDVVEVISSYVEKVVGIFGTERCMFASNFPVDKCSVTYQVLYNAYKKCCNKLKLSDGDKKNLFYQTATETYNF